MKKYFLIFFLIFMALSVQAEIKQSPDQILFSTSIGTMHTIDSFLVSPSTDGVSLFVYDDILQQYRFVQRVYIEAVNTVTSKIEDSILVIESQDEKLHFVSLKNLPEITYLGFVDLNRPFADYSLIRNSLYIAGYYDGILRYTLTDYSQIEFTDSSMTGILITQLSHDSQYLYALDEYNGLLRYELAQGSFGTFIDYLYVPLRAFAYTQIDSLFYLHLIEGGLLIGDFSRTPGDNIVDSLLNINQIENLYYTDSLLIFTGNRQLLIINRYDYSDKISFPLIDLNPKGLLNKYSSTTSLMLPSLDGGLSFVSFDTILTIQDGLEYNGTVNDILIHNSKLYLSSDTEPVHLFTIGTTGFTSFNFTLYENLPNTGQMEHNGDSLFVLYTEFDKLALIVNSDEPDSALWENSITISPSSVKNMYYNNQQLFDNALIFIEHPYSFELYAVSDSGYLAFANEWNFISDMTSFAIKDSIAVITNRKNECEVYQIDASYDKSFLKSFSLSGTATKTIFYNDLLYLFQHDEMYLLDFTDQNNIFIDTVLVLPIDVLDAVIVENQMFTVGTKGIAKFDLSGALPEITEYGGLPGNFINVDSNLIVIHDNQTVMLYYHDLPMSEPGEQNRSNNYTILAQNYPNPFNLETIINYSLLQVSDVQIAVYNILGQKIKTLIHTKQEAGNYSVSWDGTNASGNVIASGIYFYKLETADIVTAKKMILIK